MEFKMDVYLWKLNIHRYIHTYMYMIMVCIAMEYAIEYKIAISHNVIDNL